MATVTRVTQTRRPGRYNIYLDDEFAFAVAEKILLDFNLFKGTEVSAEQRVEIETAEYAQKAYQKALVYATGTMRSVQQVRQKLKEADFPDDVIEQALERLGQVDILNDQKFAEEYVSTQMQRGKLGPKGIGFKLRQYGVDAFTIEDALVVYDEETEYENLMQQVEPLFDKYQRSSAYLAQQKVSNKLYQSGFNGHLIKRALSDYFDEHEHDDEQEMDNFNREIEKLAERYADYSGWDYQQKMKAGMYRRGFNLKQVDRWLKEHSS
ncbi:recX protein [Weissella kandleri]|uniref:Regulatory protein RecX n=1 Tax=Weissella kandleri TaxID=1616 RepID=A0A0R2JL34_9LACO|nr:RecX family transcriptional regulator [Weissella kandleri]KRN75484.1 recX protein [Weissella kandleri]